MNYPGRVNVFRVKLPVRLDSDEILVEVLLWDPGAPSLEWSVNVSNGLAEYWVDRPTYKKLLSSKLNRILTLSPVSAAGGTLVTELKLRAGEQVTFKSTYLPVPKDIALIYNASTYRFSAEVQVEELGGSCGGEVRLVFSIAGVGVSKTIRPPESTRIYLEVPIEKILDYYRALSRVPVYLGLVGRGGAAECSSTYRVEMRVEASVIKIVMRHLLWSQRLFKASGEYNATSMYRDIQRFADRVELRPRGMGIIATFSVKPTENTAPLAVISAWQFSYIMIRLYGWRGLDSLGIRAEHPHICPSIEAYVNFWIRRGGSMFSGPLPGRPAWAESPLWGFMYLIWPESYRTLSNIYIATQDGFAVSRVSQYSKGHYTEYLNAPVLGGGLNRDYVHITFSTCVVGTSNVDARVEVTLIYGDSTFKAIIYDTPYRG